MKSYFSRTVWILSIVSLFTDTASEMLYPIMPLYLRSIGFSIVLIGILEGVAEAMAGLSNGYFGKLSDHSRRRMPFVQWGYSLSALSKPLMALFVTPLWVFFVRTLDRLGKGLRTGARDAMLSDESLPGTKGKVFGFHRSMDTFGAVLGPTLALLYLQWHPQEYRMLFIIAFVPGLLAVTLSLLLKDKIKTPVNKKRTLPFFSFLYYWRESPALYKKLVIGLLLFALFNSSDVFLLLKVKQTGLSDGEVILVYIFYNLVYALSALPIGIIADRVGLKKIFVSGLFLFSAVYIGMAYSTGLYTYFLLFFLYGIYAAATEGISKAWVSNITDKSDTATAIGTFTGFQSITAMLASTMAGICWFQFGAKITFLISGVAALVSLAYILTIPYNKKSNIASQPAG